MSTNSGIPNQVRLKCEGWLWSIDLDYEKSLFIVSFVMLLGTSYVTAYGKLLLIRSVIVLVQDLHLKQLGFPPK